MVDFHSGWAFCSCRYAFATENICRCRYAFAQSRASWGRPMSRFTRDARSRVSGQQMFFARKRSANVAAAEGFGFVCVKAQRQQKILDCAKAKRQQRVLFVRKRSDSNNNSTMLVTKALSQDVMVLAFVPLLLIPKESPSIHSNQLICRAYIFKNIIHNFLLMSLFIFIQQIFSVAKARQGNNKFCYIVIINLLIFIHINGRNICWNKKRFAIENVANLFLLLFDLFIIIATCN